MKALRVGGFEMRLWWVVSLLLALLVLLVGQSILTSRHQHEEQAVIETNSVARVLEGDLGGLVDKVKLALHTVGIEQERRLSGGSHDDRAVRSYIANIHFNLPDVVAIRVTDAAGRVSFPSEFENAPIADIENEAYFLRLRDSHASDVVISEPHRDGNGGPWVIDIARGIEYPDGRFAGVVYAPVALERLVKMLAAAGVGSNGAVTLRGENLALIARQPPMEGLAGVSRASEALRDLVQRGQTSGTYRAASPADGVERIVSYRKIESYPLYVTVGRATSEYLGHWRRDMGVVALLAGALFVTAIGSAVMIDRAWQRQRSIARILEKQAHTDELTGIANRRRFFEMAEAEIARTRRYDAPLSLLMLDIDRFKEVNDAHGHRSGDRVLKLLARTCLEILRNVDVVGRVGGEEFAILLPETVLEGAVEVAERLRVAIGKAEVTREAGVPLRITVSIGVAVLDASANLDTLMSRADAALYDAKHLGRNRVRAFAQAL